MPWQTTTTLLENLCNPGTDTSWYRLLDHFRRPLVQMASEMGLCPSDAEDAVQEALVAVAHSLRDGKYDRDKGRLAHWIHGIAVRQILNARRKQAQRNTRFRTARPTCFWAALAGEGQEAEEGTISRELSLLEILQDKVRREVDPEVFLAYERVIHGDHSPADVARELGVSTKWVYNAKYRVLRRIRELRRTHDSELLAHRPRTGEPGGVHRPRGSGGSGPQGPLG